MVLNEIELSCGCIVLRDGDFLVFRDRCLTLPVPVNVLKEYFKKENINRDANEGFFYFSDKKVYSLTYKDVKIGFLSEDEFENIKKLVEYQK